MSNARNERIGWFHGSVAAPTDFSYTICLVSPLQSCLLRSCCNIDESTDYGYNADSGLPPGAYRLCLIAPAYLLPAQPALDLAVKSGYNSVGDQAMRHRTVDIMAATALLGAQMPNQLKQ